MLRWVGFRNVQLQQLLNGNRKSESRHNRMRREDSRERKKKRGRRGKNSASALFTPGPQARPILNALAWKKGAVAPLFILH